MYKEACVLLKKAGWWDAIKASTKNAWNDFNDYADKHKWVRPAATAAAAGLGGAGLGALLGGGRGAAIGGLTGLIGGGTGGALWDDLRREQLSRKQYTPDKVIAANLDNMADNLSMTKKLPTDPQQRAIQLQRMKTNFSRNMPKGFINIKKDDLDQTTANLLKGIGKNTAQFMIDPAYYIRNLGTNYKHLKNLAPKVMPNVSRLAQLYNKYLYNAFNLSPQEFQQYKKQLLNINK